MTILSNDLQILASESMNDSTNGGGGLVNQQIVSGQSNNIFKSISTLKRTYGGVMMAKVFGALRTQTDEALLGAFVFLDKIPGDTQLSVNLFSTGDAYDLRSDAVSRVENYRAQGGKYLGFLYGTQYQGSQTLTIFQSTTAPVPSNGDVLFLLSASAQQYIRITSVASQVQSFSDSNSSTAYQRTIVTLGIATPLTANFVGVDMSRFDNLAPAAVIYATTVADAARYYSARPLPAGANLGDYSVTVDSVYSQVVPSSQTEMPLVDLTAAGSVTPLVQSSTNAITVPINFSLAANVSVYLGRPCYPGSLFMTYGGGTLTDNGGQLMLGGTSIGTVDYASGIVTFGANAPSLGSGSTANFQAAGTPLAVADTDSIPVTDTSRSFVYTFNINPPPQPGALSVSMLALNNWYEFTDNGTGGLVANTSGTGAGTVNYVTGSVAITFAALPDVGSNIMVAWGKKVNYVPHTGTAVAMTITRQLSQTALDASTFVIAWQDRDSGGTLISRSITSDAKGQLSGDGTGQLIASTGSVVFKPTLLPLKGTVFTMTYLYGLGSGSAGKKTKNLTSFNMTGTTVALDVGDVNIIPGSVVIDWAIPWGSSTTQQDQTFLNALGAGNVVSLNVTMAGYLELPNVSSGALQREELDNATGAFISGKRGAVINYTTGLIHFDWSDTLKLPYPMYMKNLAYQSGTIAIKTLFMGYAQLPAIMGTPADFTVTYRTNAATLAGTDTVTLSSSTLAISVDFTDPIVPNSLAFDFSGKHYIDRLGQLYSDIDPSTGAGTFAGTIDYSAGTANLTTWQAGAANTGTLNAALSTSNFSPVSKVVLRTASSPIKPSSFSIRATPASGGGQVSATANDSGVIQTAAMFGTINYNTGVAEVQFGAMVTASGNESQPWYDASAIVNGQIFQPAPVLSESIIYNAVSYTFLPLSAAILGLDPARLPIDGRIPVYHNGDVIVVLSDTQTTATFTSNTTTNLSNVRLSKITITDLGGNLLPSTKWSANLDTGVITWGDLSGISQPLTVVSRIQDMAVVSDVQINGKLSLSSPITHTYPAGALVANAVVLNDIYATASNPFDQATWNNVFSETVIGSGAGGQYDYTDYPIVVTNSGAIEEQWALVFTSQTAFNLIGAHVGQIVTGVTTAADLAPINPATGDPYFTMSHAGFGGGWYAGNAIRFDTHQAAQPVWIIQSILQGEPTSSDYSFSLCFSGDVTAS